MSALLLIFLLASPSDFLSDGMQLIPMWERMNCGKAVMACYNFDQAKELYKIDLKMRFELKKVELLESTSKDLQQAITKFDQIDMASQRTINNLQDILKENEKVVFELKKENLDLREPSFFGKWYVLSLGAIAFFVAGAVVGHAL